MIMDIKKLLLTLLLSAAVACSFASCSGKDSDEGGTDSADAANVQANASLSAAELADKLFNDIEYVDSLGEISPEMIEKLYGISSDKYSSAKVYVGGASTAEEIACFDAADETAAGEILSACQARIDSQIKAVEDYNPDELAKLNDPVLVTRGNSVYMCLSNDNDKAEEIIG